MRNRNKSPNFLGIGAPKCGTTWLAEVLRKHPDVFIPHAKEIVYFSSKKKFSKGEEWYLNHFSGISNEQAAGEFSVAYMVEPESSERIYTFNPEMKLIAVLRDPVMRAYSHFRWLCQMGKMKSTSFLAAVNNEPQVLQGSLFYQNLLPYWERFPAENILILKFEDLKQDAYGFQQRVFRFLGVNSMFEDVLVKKVVGKTISPRSHLLEKMRIKTHVFARTHNAAFLIYLFKKTGLSEFYRRINDKKNYKISQKEYLEASELFKDDVKALHEKTGMDFTDWLTWSQE